MVDSDSNQSKSNQASEQEISDKASSIASIKPSSNGSEQADDASENKNEESDVKSNATGAVDTQQEKMLNAFCAKHPKTRVTFFVKECLINICLNCVPEYNNKEIVLIKTFLGEHQRQWKGLLNGLN